MGEWIYFNPNPTGKHTGDCVIRAISRVTGMSWDETYCAICAQGFDDKDMPSSDSVWNAYLREIGFKRRIIPDTCPHCYTVRDFCRDNPKGAFVLGTGSHAVAVVDGNYYDIFDSGDEIPVFYFQEG